MTEFGIVSPEPRRIPDWQLFYRLDLPEYERLAGSARPVLHVDPDIGAATLAGWGGSTLIRHKSIGRHAVRHCIGTTRFKVWTPERCHQLATKVSRGVSIEQAGMARFVSFRALPQ